MSETKITGPQIRAARGFLDWSRAELARAADAAHSTVQSIEGVGGDARISGGPDKTLEYRVRVRNEALTKIATAFAKRGVTFVPDDGRAGQGVRWRGKGI